MTQAGVGESVKGWDGEQSSKLAGERPAFKSLLCLCLVSVSEVDRAFPSLGLHCLLCQKRLNRTCSFCPSERGEELGNIYSGPQEGVTPHRVLERSAGSFIE